jgi:RNA polymerase sigma-70 factor, ECF subfamily
MAIRVMDGQDGRDRRSDVQLDMKTTTDMRDDDTHLIAALRRGDEAAFVMLVERYHRALVRVALAYVPSQSVAEEVAQEAWLGVLTGIGRFEGRASLKTWLFRIVVNRARTRGQRERRSVPFSALGGSDDDAPAVDPDRFQTADGRYPGHWVAHPASWEPLPDEAFLARETRARIQAAIETLPPSQREVITLRDIDGWSSADVCNVLEISETNQRVLLHRARSKVRRALEEYLNGEAVAGAEMGERTSV